MSEENPTSINKGGPLTMVFPVEMQQIQTMDGFGSFLRFSHKGEFVEQAGMGRGFAMFGAPDGSFTLKVYISDTSHFPVGTIDWQIHLRTMNGMPVYDDAGNIIGMPPFLSQAGQFEVVEPEVGPGGNQPFDLMFPEGDGLVDGFVRNERLKICVTCPFYREGMCQKCGCAMNSKTGLAGATCPDEKW